MLYTANTTYSARGAFEINLRARERQAQLNPLRAAWQADHRPAAPRHNQVAAWLAGLQALLSGLRTAQA